jgi:hypothetical protein
MDPIQDLYKKVKDNNRPLSERTDALSKLVDLYLTSDVMKVLSSIATDSTLPFQMRQTASDRITQKK